MPTLPDQRRVEFRDTDAAGMAHFSVFFVFMEQAEHELLRHLGLSVMLHDDAGQISFPRVGARCDYQRAVKFEDVLDIEVADRAAGQQERDLRIQLQPRGPAVASGQTTTVCCRFDSRRHAPVDRHSGLDRREAGAGLRSVGQRRCRSPHVARAVRSGPPN